MSLQERRERERTGMKTAILEAAQSIAAQDGWQAVTIRRVAERIEYSAPTIYEHFKNKDAMLYELMLDGFRQLRLTLANAENTVDAPALRLVAISHAYRTFAFANPETYRLLHGLNGVPFGTNETPPEARAVFALLREALERALQTANVSVVDVDSEVEIWWGTLHGLIALTMSGRIMAGEERIENLLNRAVFNLLLAWKLDRTG